MRYFVFDVDGTVCDSGQEIAPRMAALIERLVRRGNKVAFISGTDEAELKRMLRPLECDFDLMPLEGQSLLRRGPCESYAHLYDRGEEFTASERVALRKLLGRLYRGFGIVPLSKDTFLDRGAQITFSLLGRSAPLAKKLAFDPDGVTRNGILYWLRPLLPKGMVAKVGGTTSIDIHRREWDKGKGLHIYKEYTGAHKIDLCYFGDKMRPGGNDYPALDEVGSAVPVGSPDDTANMLSFLLREGED